MWPFFFQEGLEALPPKPIKLKAKTWTIVIVHTFWRRRKTTFLRFQIELEGSSNNTSGLIE